MFNNDFISWVNSHQKQTTDAVHHHKKANPLSIMLVLNCSVQSSNKDLTPSARKYDEVRRCIFAHTHELCHHQCSGSAAPAPCLLALIDQCFDQPWLHDLSSLLVFIYLLGDAPGIILHARSEAKSRTITVHALREKSLNAALKKKRNLRRFNRFCEGPQISQKHPCDCMMWVRVWCEWHMCRRVGQLVMDKLPGHTSCNFMSRKWTRLQQVIMITFNIHVFRVFNQPFFIKTGWEFSKITSFLSWSLQISNTQVCKSVLQWHFMFFLPWNHHFYDYFTRNSGKKALDLTQSTQLHL